MSARQVLRSSFRDPSGFLFVESDALYRQVNPAYKDNYDRLIESGLYRDLVGAGLLIPHETVERPEGMPAGAYKILRPERLPFISYPFEWSFGQLKDAALATLRVQRRALDFGMSLKDASAYNIQFRGGKPILIDTLSFEVYQEGSPWVAYRQFCQHFLAPLALMSHKDVRLGQLLRLYIDGVPLSLASSLLPSSTRFDFGLLSHIHLHAGSEKRFAGKPVDVSGRRVSRLGYLGLLESLESTVRHLQWRPQGTAWAGYYAGTNYTPAGLEHKTRLVAGLLAEITPAPRLLWDLGANTGLFSRLASDRGIETIAFDSDPGAVELAYRQAVEKGEAHLLPLLVDLTNPSPAIGWANEEREALLQRGPADAAMALALVHHLAIANNLPLGRIAEFLSRACRWLIIEFVPKSDSQVQRLLASRQDIFGDYTREAFEAEFGRYFRVRRAADIPETQRSLYLMERGGQP